MFAPLGVELVRQADLGVGEAEEPHRTFVENALAKARFASATHRPARAGRRCGPVRGRLWRPAGRGHGLLLHPVRLRKKRRQQRARVLEQMQGVDNRRAAMVSTLVAVRSPQDPEPLIAVGRVVGEITTEPRGSNGFGFDPVMFIPEFGKTFAELPVEVKNAHSHRGRSAQQMLALMRERWPLNIASA
jgi:XTP/dITP diphosphohydrolase